MKDTVQPKCKLSLKKFILKFHPLVLRYDNGVKTMSLRGRMLIEEGIIAQESL